MNVLDNAKTVADAIRKSGGTEEDIRLWNKTWADLMEFCDFESGVTDDYTKDLVLCWVGWVVNASSDTSNVIYNAVKGFNLTVREDESGIKGTNRLYAGIDKHTSDPVSLYRELAKDQLERMRSQGTAQSISKEITQKTTALSIVPRTGEVANNSGSIDDILDTDDDIVE